MKIPCVRFVSPALALLLSLLLLVANHPAESWLAASKPADGSRRTTVTSSSSSSRLAAAAAAATNSNNSKIPSNVRLLILPGFGNESEDYYLPQAPVGSLVGSLQKRGWSLDQIRVLPLQRLDWLQVFRKGALDVQFWLAQAPPTRPAFRWYLDRIATCIEELTTTPAANGDEAEDISVVIIAHSAGGWLARAALGFGNAAEKKDDATTIPLDRVLGMVTLGAPHLPPPPTVMDMTRGALRITHEEFPGAYHAKDLFYITAIGNAVRGVKRENDAAAATASLSSSVASVANENEAAAKLARFAFNSYEAVCGQGDAVGDGVVPVSAGHLDGALQLDLEGIYHSIGTPEKWYGSDSVLDDWHNDMLGEIQKQLKSRQQRRRRQGGTQQQQKSAFTNPLENLFRR